MMSDVNQSKDMCVKTNEEGEQMKQLPYREIVGKLLWLSLSTRPDIMYATTQCAKFCNDYGPTHWYSLMYILSYLSGTEDYGLVYNTDSTIDIPMGYFKSDHIDKVIYSDADFSRDKDTSRSVSGYVYILSGSPISWMSKQQREVALSSMESEYYAAGYAIQEAIWVDSLLEELKMRVDKPMVIQDDNNSAILFSDHPTDHARTKHIKRRYHFVREAVANKEVELVKKITEYNLADLFTKPLNVKRFQMLRDRMLSNVSD